MDEESETEREESLKEEIKKQMSAAEITNIKIENVTDHVKPLIYSYHVRFPNYAQRTGKRLFLQPAFFQHGLGPSSPPRIESIRSTSTIRGPKTTRSSSCCQRVMHLTTPMLLHLSAAGISEYKANLSAATDGTLLVYKRSFYFGDGIGALSGRRIRNLKTFSTRCTSKTITASR